MKRKDFIQKIGFLGVGLSLTPWKLLSAEPPIHTYNLPTPIVHIPHGNFAAAEIEKLIIPELELECTVQQFMRHGISDSDEDLTVYSFEFRKEVMNVSFTRNGQRFSNGFISGLRLTFGNSEISGIFNNCPFILLRA